jgi:L-ascorbate metabolism protein UlaG (beta-lactamase superfamily)
MYITWLGQSCFKIQTKPQKETEEVTMITDPYGNIGLRMPRLTADIVTVSHAHFDHNNVTALQGNPLVVDQAGEYEIKKIFIYGLISYHDKNQGTERGKNIIYKIQTENLVLTHLGDIGHILDNGLIEKLEGTDILMIPVGGTFTVGAKLAAEIVQQIEPRIVIPMHYKIAGLNIKLEPVDNFLKEMGVSKKEMVEKLKITKKELAAEKMQVIVMTKK